jgi:hypothetical protein
MTTTASATHSAPVTAIHRLEVPGGDRWTSRCANGTASSPYWCSTGGARTGPIG